MFQKVQRSPMDVSLSNRIDASCHEYDGTVTVNYQEKIG